LIYSFPKLKTQAGKKKRKKSEEDQVATTPSVSRLVLPLIASSDFRDTPVKAYRPIKNYKSYALLNICQGIGYPSWID
jgi:hypothetical protein